MSCPAVQAMASELNMYESQVNEYKYEIERLSRDLHEAKKKYFTQRKKEQQAKYTNYSYNPAFCFQKYSTFKSLIWLLSYNTIQYNGGI